MPYHNISLLAGNGFLASNGFIANLQGTPTVEAALAALVHRSLYLLTAILV